jgi:predicted nucleic acid-binding protein
MLVLLDNTVMSNFSSVQHPELVRLALAGQEVGTTEQAFAEMQAGVRKGKIPPCDWTWLVVIALQSSEELLFQRLAQNINVGEASCLAVAASRGYRFLTDDRDARQLARSIGVPVSGSLGVLKILVEQGHLGMEEADKLLQEMIATGYRSPVKSLVEIP